MRIKSPCIYSYKQLYSRIFNIVNFYAATKNISHLRVELILIYEIKFRSMDAYISPLNIHIFILMLTIIDIR